MAFATVVSTTIMTGLVLSAYIQSTVKWFKGTLDPKPVVSTVPAPIKDSVCDYATHYGFLCHSYELVTHDGFIIELYRIRKKESQAGDILISGRHSLAFVLADAGYDVWLGNIRCVQKRHCYLDPNDSEFWDWSLDEIAKYDFPGMLDFVLKHTGRSQSFVLGHSQGVAQVLMALQYNEEISSKIKCLFALSPPLYIGDLLDSQPICHAVHLPNATFHALFGTKEFLSASTYAQYYLPKTIFMSLAYQMFHYMFGWRHSNWVESHKIAYFQFTPRSVSTKCILHWFQITRTNRQLQPFQKEESFKDETPFIYELKKIKCPLSIVYGGKDRIINADLFVKECLLPKHNVQLISSLKIEEYEHMDVLWAWNAKEKVFQHILQQMNFILKKETM